jgi:AraC-like DNA-binding protein
MEKKFVSQKLQHILNIRQVVSVFYSDLGHNFISRGESHDFWEMVYVDRGHLHIETDTETFPLSQGEICFHAPMSYHRHISDFIEDTSLCIVSFYCKNTELYTLVDQILCLTDSHRLLLSETLKYGTAIFSEMVDTKDSLYLIRKPNTAPELDQIFTNYLEIFLLQCINLKKSISKEPITTTYHNNLTKNHKNKLGQEIINYLIAHVTKPFSIGQMCEDLGYSKTTLSAAFKSYTGSTIIPYFNRLKIETAKSLMRSRDMSLTEISAYLNFCNLNYFSTAFKNYTGMYPREYAKSLKVHNGVYLLNPEHDAIIRHTDTDKA